MGIFLGILYRNFEAEKKGILMKIQGMLMNSTCARVFCYILGMGLMQMIIWVTVPV